MATKNFVGEKPMGNEIFWNLKNLCIFVFVVFKVVGKTKKWVFERKKLKVLSTTLLITVVLQGSVFGLDLKKNLNELIDESIYIVIGSVKDMKSAWDDNKTGIYTTIDINVEEVIKEPAGSDLLGNVISLNLKGGTVEEITMIVMGNPQFELDEKTLLFLNRDKNNKIYVTGAFQGKYTIKNGQILNKEKGININAQEFIEEIRKRIKNPTYDVEKSLKDKDIRNLATSELGITMSALATHCYNISYKWHTNVVIYRKTLPPGWATAVDNCARAWNGKAEFMLVDGGTYAGGCRWDTLNVVCTGDVWFPGRIAEISYVFMFGRIVDADIMFDTTDYVWYNGTSRDINDICPVVGNSSRFDVWNVAAHEFGHLLGLGHPPNECIFETMYEYVYPCEIIKRDIHTGDLAGIVALYGAATPPIQSNHAPPNGSTITTTSPTITFNLNENGDCRWSLTDQAYSAMTGDCTGDGTTSQSCVVSGLAQGWNRVYIACRDTLGNQDTAATNTELSYRVDTIPPIQSSHNPVNGSTITTTSPTITFHLNENGDCRWSLTDQAYSAMTRNCTGNGTLQSCAVSGLTRGWNTVYIACQDAMGNQDTATTNTELRYEIVRRPTVPEIICRRLRLC